MAPQKHRDDQLFVAPVKFWDTCTFNDDVQVNGAAKFAGTIDAIAKGIVLGPADADHTLNFFDNGGAWTPELWGLADGPGTSTLSIALGKFFVIGNRVFYEIHVKVSSLGDLVATDPAFIGNLPVPIKAGSVGGGWVNQLVGMNLPGLHAMTVNADSVRQSLKLNMMVLAAGTGSVTMAMISADGDMKISGHYEKA